MSSRPRFSVLASACFGIAFVMWLGVMPTPASLVLAGITLAIAEIFFTWVERR